MATALLIAGAGLLAVGQIKQGQVAAAQGKFAKQIALRNQAALERQAKAEQDVARIEERRVARKEKIIKAGQRTIVGKSGIGLAGATLSALTDTAFQFSLDRNLALRRGLFRARELVARGGILAAGGTFAKTVGRQQRTASFISAGGSVLTAAGTAGLRPSSPGLGTPSSTNIGTSQSFRLGISPPR